MMIELSRMTHPIKLYEIHVICIKERKPFKLIKIKIAC